uniref:Apple domain-containing protein n=1 Tax=Macrostomum lignano TaxID=282301 RepID=A0A1I8J9Y7_9PLAT
MKSVAGISNLDCSVKCAQTAGCSGFSWLQSLCQLFELSAFSGTWLSSPPCEIFKKIEEPAAATMLVGSTSSTLLVDGVECNRVDLTEPFSIANFTCNAFGSAVRVVTQLSNHLVICEVEIYGY